MDILRIINIFGPILISLFGLVFAIKTYNLNKKLQIQGLESDKKEEYEKKYKTGRTALLIISLILFGVLIFTGIYINNISTENTKLESKIIELNETKKERIVLLFPIDSDKESDAYDDGERQALGFIDFLKIHNDKASNYNFVVRNHELDFDAAEDIIIEELQKGTKYFICTMSSVARPISKVFESHVNEYYKGEGTPIFISTVASSPIITEYLKENCVYRFYIRSDEEGEELAKAVHKINKYKTATSIAVHDDYGEGAVKKFEEEWIKLGHTFNKGILVDINCDEEMIYKQVKDQIKDRYSQSNREVIFIAHYGGGLDKIINSIYKLGMKPLIVATSTLSIKNWQRPIKEPLDSLNWITCVPRLKDSGGKLFEGDVVKDFVYFNLDRLISILEKCNITNKDFNTVWHELNEPKRIDYEILQNGDSKINLEIDYNNFKE